jgi:flavin reductase (DIM6/NTAB) family NADH-FMN oxidoreductase RutF
MTANAIASISVDPPIMMASISKHSETHTAIVGSHSFAISVLSAGQRELAECFAQPITETKLRRFCDAPWHEAETGSPILDGAIAYFDCRLVHRYDGGDHTIFLGEIVSAGYEENADPLLFFAGAYRNFSDA